MLLVNFPYITLEELSHGALSIFWPCTKSPLNGRKPENNGLLKIEKHQRDSNQT